MSEMAVGVRETREEPESARGKQGLSHVSPMSAIQEESLLCEIEKMPICDIVRLRLGTCNRRLPIALSEHRVHNCAKWQVGQCLRIWDTHVVGNSSRVTPVEEGTQSGSDVGGMQWLT